MTSGSIPLQTAEKGIAWLRLSATGTAGHGSMIHNDNAVTTLAAAVARIGQHEWPIRLVPSVREFLEAASAAIGMSFDPDDLLSLLGKLGPAARMVGATLKNTANPTGLKAGYKVNVIPQTATAEVDCRFLPGLEDEFLAEIDRLLGDNVRREFIHHDIALETTADGALYDAMTASLLAEDPAAQGCPVLPVRRDRRQVVRQDRHPLLRLQPAPAAAGHGLQRDVPRHRRARDRGRPALRHPGLRPLPRPLLIPVRSPDE